MQRQAADVIIVALQASPEIAGWGKATRGEVAVQSVVCADVLRRLSGWGEASGLPSSTGVLYALSGGACAGWKPKHPHCHCSPKHGVRTDLGFEVTCAGIKAVRPSEQTPLIALLTHREEGHGVGGRVIDHPKRSNMVDDLARSCVECIWGSHIDPIVAKGPLEL